MLRLAHALDVPAHVELAFEGGVPVAVNGIVMALPELTESLATIAGDHGIGLMSAPSVPDAPADVVLGHAREALVSNVDRGGSGIVTMKLHLGEHTIVSVSPSAAQHS